MEYLILSALWAVFSLINYFVWIQKNETCSTVEDYRRLIPFVLIGPFGVLAYGPSGGGGIDAGGI